MQKLFDMKDNNVFNGANGEETKKRVKDLAKNTAKRTAKKAAKSVPGDLST